MDPGKNRAGEISIARSERPSCTADSVSSGKIKEDRLYRRREVNCNLKGGPAQEGEHRSARTQENGGNVIQGRVLERKGSGE